MSSEDAAIGTISLFTNLLYNLVHSPSVQLSVAEYSQRHVVLLSVSLYSFKAVVTIALDSLVNGQEDEIKPIVVALVECLENGGKHSAVFSTRSANGDFFAAVEEGISRDGVVDFGFEDGDEAHLA